MLLIKVPSHTAWAVMRELAEQNTTTARRLL